MSTEYNLPPLPGEPVTTLFPSEVRFVSENDLLMYATAAIEADRAARYLNDAERFVAGVPALPVAEKSHGAWDGLETLGDLPDGTQLFAHPPATTTQVQDAKDAETASARRALAALRDKLLTLETDAHFIFNNPPGETSQEVRDVIEWFKASLMVECDAAIAAQKGQP